MTTPPLDLLVAARLLLSDEACWTKGCAAKNIRDVSCSTNLLDAKSFCSLGALYAFPAHGDDAAVSREYLEAAFCLLYGPCSITVINDRRETTHADILRAYDLAIDILS